MRTAEVPTCDGTSATSTGIRSRPGSQTISTKVQTPQLESSAISSFKPPSYGGQLESFNPGDEWLKRVEEMVTSNIEKRNLSLVPTAKLLTRNVDNSNLPPEEKWLKDVQEMIRTDRKLSENPSEAMKRQNLEPFAACSDKKYVLRSDVSTSKSKLCVTEKSKPNKAEPKFVAEKNKQLTASKADYHSYWLEKPKDLAAQDELCAPSLKPRFYRQYHQQQKKEIITLMRKH